LAEGSPGNEEDLIAAYWHFANALAVLNSGLRRTNIRFLVKVPYWQHSSLRHFGRSFVRRGGLRMTVFGKKGLRMTARRKGANHPSARDQYRRR